MWVYHRPLDKPYEGNFTGLTRSAPHTDDYKDYVNSLDREEGKQPTRLKLLHILAYMESRLVLEGGTINEDVPATDLIKETEQEIKRAAEIAALEAAFGEQLSAPDSTYVPEPAPPDPNPDPVPDPNDPLEQLFKLGEQYPQD